MEEDEFCNLEDDEQNPDTEPHLPANIEAELREAVLGKITLKNV